MACLHIIPSVTANIWYCAMEESNQSTSLASDDGLYLLLRNSRTVRMMTASVAMRIKRNAIARALLSGMSVEDALSSGSKQLRD